MDALCGASALSLEGQLSKVSGTIAAMAGVGDDETPVLKRNTIAPIQDFVVLPLEWDTVETLKTTILNHLNLNDDVIHVQIAKDGVHVFGIYDLDYPEPPNFLAASAVTDDVLKQWVSRRLIRGFDKHRV